MANEFIARKGIISIGDVISNNIKLNALDSYGYGFWTANPITYGILMSSSTNGTYGGRIAGESTSDYNMYFTMNGGTNRGFVFRSSYGTRLFSVNPNGIRSSQSTYITNSNGTDENGLVVTISESDYLNSSILTTAIRATNNNTHSGNSGYTGTGVYGFGGNYGGYFIANSTVGYGTGIYADGEEYGAIINSAVSDIALFQSNYTTVCTIGASGKITADSIVYVKSSCVKPVATSVSGEIVYYGTGTTTAGVLYYLNTSLVWTISNANTGASASNMLGIAVGTNPATNGMLIRGFARFSSSPYTTMTGGQILFVSTTAGEFTATAPSGTGDIVRIIGYCVDATNDTLYFNPDNTWIEVV